MALKLVFLGRLEDAAGCAEREVPVSGSVEGVLSALEPDLAAALRADNVKLAVNGVLISGVEGLILHDGDELAFLPPVSGG